MQAASTWDLIWLGTSLRFLQDVGQNWSPNSPDGVVVNFDGFVRECDKAGLTVTSRAAEISLRETVERLRKTPESYTITAQDQATIVLGMSQVRLTLSAEAAGHVIYRASERRYDVTKLMGEMDKLFAGGVFTSLSEIARYDFSEAGRGLAFGMPTATAFHLLRGTEEVLRAYYRSWIRRGRMRVMMWGPMVDSLRGLTGRHAPDATVLNHLDNIRMAFRNPTDHPDKIYDLGEAEDLVGLCLEVVNRMVRTMRP